MAQVDLITAAGGNLGSVRRMLIRTGTVFKSVETPADLSWTNPVILPGVGAFRGVMENLEISGLSGLLKDLANHGTPLLGICSGMQVLFGESEESPGVRGLGIIPGRVVRLREGKVPNVGWCRLESSGSYVYFVNSYHCTTDFAEDFADHNGERFTAMARMKTVTGFQFHPEISHDAGAWLFRRWLNGL